MENVIGAAHVSAPVDERRILFVKSTTYPKDLGKSIYSTYAKEGRSEMVLRSVGGGAISQAAKGLILANGFLSARGIKAITELSFADVPDQRNEGQSITAIEFKVTFVRV